jgi:hypothetical protein
MADEAGEKKIFVDEDWKTRVEEERAEHAKKQQETAQHHGDQTAELGKPPPASLEMLLTTLATEAMVGLGQIPHPTTGQATLNLDQAKYFIDTIDVLRTKTRGNLTSAEEQAIETLLHQLRMAYVATLHPPAPEAGPETPS